MNKESVVHTTISTYEQVSSSLYLLQSKRYAEKITSLIGKNHWTNYTAWEYVFNAKNNKIIELDLAYTNKSLNTSRFVFIEKGSRKVLYTTEHLEEAVRFINTNKSIK